MVPLPWPPVRNLPQCRERRGKGGRCFPVPPPLTTGVCTNPGSSPPSLMDGEPLGEQYGPLDSSLSLGQETPRTSRFQRERGFPESLPVEPLSFLVKAQGAQDLRSLVGSCSQSGEQQNDLFWRGCCPSGPVLSPSPGRDAPLPWSGPLSSLPPSTS